MNSELAGNLITSLVIDGEDQIWIGTGSGLSIFSPDGSQATHTIANSPLPSEYVLALTLDSQDRVLIGTSYGLYRLDKDGNWELFPPDEGVMYPFDEVPEGTRMIFSRIEALALDENGRVWMGNNRSGSGSAITVMDEEDNWDTYGSSEFRAPGYHDYLGSHQRTGSGLDWDMGWDQRARG